MGWVVPFGKFVRGVKCGRDGRCVLGYRSTRLRGSGEQGRGVRRAGGGGMASRRQYRSQENDAHLEEYVDIGGVPPRGPAMGMPVRDQYLPGFSHRVKRNDCPRCLVVCSAKHNFLECRKSPPQKSILYILRGENAWYISHPNLATIVCLAHLVSRCTRVEGTESERSDHLSLSQETR